MSGSAEFGYGFEEGAEAALRFILVTALIAGILALGLLL